MKYALLTLILHLRVTAYIPSLKAELTFSVSSQNSQIYKFVIHVTSVDTVTCLLAGQPRNRSSISGRGKGFSRFHKL
jgi:hypothetical protein